MRSAPPALPVLFALAQLSLATREGGDSGSVPVPAGADWANVAQIEATVAGFEPAARHRDTGHWYLNLVPAER
jgi:hypothetical protein